MADVILVNAGRNKIAVIKVIRELTRLGLKEAKDLADQSGSVVLRGVDATQAQAAVAALAAEGAQARTVAGAGGGARAPGAGQVGDLWDSPAASGAPGGYSLWLLDAGRNKIAVIKEIREVTGLGLKEAKDIADGPPQMVAGGLDRAVAERASQALSAAGGRAEVRPA